MTMNSSTAEPPRSSDNGLQQRLDQAHLEVTRILAQWRQQTTELIQVNMKMGEEIAKHRQIEELLQASNAEALAATRTKDKFVALVAHDLKSPLGAIMGLLEFMRDDHAQPLAPEHLEILNHVINSGRGMIKLINNILNISRLRSGKITLEPTFNDGRFLVEDIIVRLSPHAKSKGIVISNTIPPYTRIYGDRTLLGEVVQNLLSNAIKFSLSGQTIEIRANSDQPAQEVVIQVIDQGVGIPRDAIPHLFQVEERTTTLGTSGETGTGFGLPFSQDILQIHLGKLTVASQPNQGSCFTIHLPMVRPKVLVVDDLRTARLLYRSALELLDPEIHEAGDGQEALAMIQTIQPDLVISDIIMPVMDGFELLTQIKANPTMAHLNVIMVTTDEQIETRERAFSLGARDFVTKPIILCDFLPRIRHWIG